MNKLDEYMKLIELVDEKDFIILKEIDLIIDKQKQNMINFGVSKIKSDFNSKKTKTKLVIEKNLLEAGVKFNVLAEKYGIKVRFPNEVNSFIMFLDSLILDGLKKEIKI